jgi:outer membrane protein
MRACVITIIFLNFGLTFVNAQRFGYIDTKYVLEKMPEYKKAQDEINQLSEAWEKEIKEMAKKIEAMYSAYQAEQVLLTDEMKKDRTDAIKSKEAELKEYQRFVLPQKAGID